MTTIDRPGNLRRPPRRIRILSLQAGNLNEYTGVSEEQEEEQTQTLALVDAADPCSGGFYLFLQRSRESCRRREMLLFHRRTALESCRCGSGHVQENFTQPPQPTLRQSHHRGPPISTTMGKSATFSSAAPEIHSTTTSPRTWRKLSSGLAFPRPPSPATHPDSAHWIQWCGLGKSTVRINTPSSPMTFTFPALCSSPASIQQDAIGYVSETVGMRRSFKTRFREIFARVLAVLDVYVLHTEPRELGAPSPIQVAKN